MRALDILSLKVDPEGFNISQEALALMVRARLELGKDRVFQYDNVVFTVSTDVNEPLIHICALDSGNTFISACRRFMKDVWEQTDHTFLLAPILNKRVMRLAEFFGWKAVEHTLTGHVIYRINRR